MHAVIPTLNEKPDDYAFLFDLDQAVRRNVDRELNLDFHRCRFLRPNAVALLGSIVRRAQGLGQRVTLVRRSLDPDVELNLTKNKFLPKLGISTNEVPGGNTIPYQEDRVFVKNRTVDYLSKQWLGKGWPTTHLSETLKWAIISHVTEIYVNASDHSGSPFGIFSCGQYYPHLKQLQLTVVDTGVGIPTRVRQHFGDDPKDPELPAAACLEWAVGLGNSTRQRTDHLRRGVGLEILRSFAKQNNGQLELLSNEAKVTINRHGDRYQNCPKSFRGTVVNLTIACDEKYYSL